MFDDIIDAMIFELYFEDKFNKAEISILKYVLDLFDRAPSNQTKIFKDQVHNIYQSLRDVENPLRNNLKLMDIRLKDLVVTIKSLALS